MERLVLTWVGKPLAFELKPGLNRFGRNPTNDYRVADASISSFHCEVSLEPDKTVLVRDLASTNGTFIDGIPLLDGEIKQGQTLRLGTVELQLEVAMVAEPQREPEPAMAREGHTQMWTREEKPSIFGRLTQTLKLPFGR
jgi:pSer/pThr/pTyr-binding forkhead associated (FHA) protein